MAFSNQAIRPYYKRTDGVLLFSAIRVKFGSTRAARSLIYASSLFFCVCESL